jgi:hypothetical protein
MKKIILFSLFCFLFFTPISKAQESTSFSRNWWSTKTSFFEWNFGIAFVTLGSEDNFPFPGSSALWGTTFINQENVIFEYEVGFAFPLLVTGKIGVGKRFNTTNIVVGVRPWPFNLYAQTSFSTTKNKSWIASIEGNPLGEGFTIGNINVGYRWNITSK